MPPKRGNGLSSDLGKKNGSKSSPPVYEKEVRVRQAAAEHRQVVTSGVCCLQMADIVATIESERHDADETLVTRPPTHATARAPPPAVFH